MKLLSYKLEFKKKALKFFQKHQDIKPKFIEAFKDIANNKTCEYDIKKMSGHIDFYRLRLGKYRAIYTIINDELIILVLDIGSRGDIYK